MVEVNMMTNTPQKNQQVGMRPRRRKRDPFEFVLASLLTLDWEINYENIEKYEGELKTVKNNLADDRYSKKLIDLTLPVCNYLRVRKEKASPASMQFLHSATRTLLRFYREKPKASERKQTLERLAVNFKNLMVDVRKLERSVPTARKPTQATEVLRVIKSRRDGIDLSTLKRATGLTDNQIRNIIYRESKKGNIKRKSRGVYVPAQH
jgi:hypothetical protein